MSDYVEGNVLDPDDPLLPIPQLRAAMRWAMAQRSKPYMRWVPCRDDAPAGPDMRRALENVSEKGTEVNRDSKEDGSFVGSIGGPIYPSQPIPLGKGVAVVSDEALTKYGREHFERLNGGNSVVLSASEALEGLPERPHRGELAAGGRTMSEPTLADFLLARIAEDEAAARKAGGKRWQRFQTGGVELIDAEQIGSAFADTVCFDEGSPSEAQAEHIVRHDPARVLAECEAKQRIVETHDCWADVCGWPCGVLAPLAAVFSAHPDYRADWSLDET